MLLTTLPHIQEVARMAEMNRLRIDVRLAEMNWLRTDVMSQHDKNIVT
jgi:hypothetical protein